MTESFLARWSRRRSEALEANREQPSPAEEPAAEDREDELAGLPDIQSLGRESDFSVFMRAGVPAALRRQALRKLWVSDPMFSHVDGLVEYGEDFGGRAAAGGVVRTAWRLGRGMPQLPPDDGAGDQASNAESVEPEPVEAAGTERASADRNNTDDET